MTKNFTASGHGKIEGIGVCLTKCQKSLTHKFGLSSISSVQDVIDEFEDSGEELEEEIEQVLKVGRKLLCSLNVAYPHLLTRSTIKTHE